MPTRVTTRTFSEYWIDDWAAPPESADGSGACEAIGADTTCGKDCSTGAGTGGTGTGAAIGAATGFAGAVTGLSAGTASPSAGRMPPVLEAVTRVGGTPETSTNCAPT